MAWQTRPAMPLDAPTVSYALPDGVDPPGLLAYLDKRFPVIAEQEASRSYTVLDTADRRLRDAGVDLDLETGRGGPRLVLREPGGRAPLVAEARRPRRNRYLLRDLPPGRSASGWHRSSRCGRCCRWPTFRSGPNWCGCSTPTTRPSSASALASPVALVGSGAAGAVPLTPRVDVSGVLGYPKPLDRVTAVVRRGPKGGLVDAPISLADEAIAAIGGDPEGIRTKVRVDLRPDQRTDRAAVAVLCDLAGMVEANLPGTLADLRHRVPPRPARGGAAQPLGAARAEGRLPARTRWPRQRDALRWIQAVTGPTRDLDVQLLDWDHLVSGIPVERHAALAPVRAHAGPAPRRRLPGAAPGAAGPAYRAGVGRLPGIPGRRPGTGPRAAGRQATDRRCGRPPDPQGLPADGGDGRRHRRRPARPTHLHELRKRGKELRYLLELFGGLWPRAVVKPMVRSLKGLQDVLGIHQDREVQAVHLRGLAGELASSTGGPAALLALGVLVDRLDAEQHEARDAFAERFAAFAAPDQQALVAKVFVP